MFPELELFVSLAELAGVFVGFGALIAFIRPSDASEFQIAGLQGIVAIGLLVILAALTPVGLSIFEIGEQYFWKYSSGIFLVYIWTGIATLLITGALTGSSPVSWSSQPIFATVLWVLLEIPIQLPLILNLFDILTQFEYAFYTTALLLNLFQAAILLAALVFKKE